MCMNFDPLLDPLNDAQRQVVLNTQGQLLVLAGAGSGKTKALTHRIAYIIRERLAHPSQILAVTFTNKAAKEMRARVQGLLGDDARFVPRYISTFHSLGMQILREQPDFHARSKSFTIVDSKDSEKLVRESMAKYGISPKQWSPTVFRSMISKAKNAQQTPDVASSQVQDFSLGQAFAKVYSNYQSLLAKNDAFDFDDLLLEPFRMVSEHASVREFYQKKWNYISIDEYQDTNPLQDAFMRLLMNDNQNLCVVGDDYQAIYSWRGAKVDHILQFETLYPIHKTTAQPLQLSRRLMRLFLPMFIRSIRNFGRRLRMATPCNLWRLVQTDRNLAGFARAFSNTWQMEALFEIALCYIALTHNPV